MRYLLVPDNEALDIRYLHGPPPRAPTLSLPQYVDLILRALAPCQAVLDRFRRHRVLPFVPGELESWLTQVTSTK